MPAAPAFLLRGSKPKLSAFNVANKTTPSSIPVWPPS